MRLGRDTGSVINWLSSGTKGAPEPEVGMGVTVLMWTDRHAGTITRIENFKTGPNAGKAKAFWYREDKATRTDNHGMSEMQHYEFAPDPDAPERRAIRKKDGSWNDGSRIAVGYRSKYHDFSF